MVAGVLVLAGGTGAALAAQRANDRPSAPATVSVQTTVVARTDLSNGTTFAGTLGFGDPQTIKGDGAGVVTKLPAVGDLATRGQALYRVNDQPVPVFFGDTPFFRTLDTPGLQGSDVAVLESNLIALGFYTGHLPKDPHDATLTANMLLGLKNWQAHTGLPTTGTLTVGQVLVLPGPARVSAVTAQLGDPATSNLLSLTSTTKLVTISAPADQAGAIQPGAQANISLPTGTTTAGKVTAIGTAPPSSTPTGGSATTNIAITVTPDDQQALGNLDTAGVTVQITTVVHPNVLAVPISALLALKEGGYALQLPDGRLIPVRTGLFTDQLVEVSGPGLAAGLRVVTAS